MVDELYQQMIFGVFKACQQKGLKTANFYERGHNPSCGDDLTLMIDVDADIVKDAAFMGTVVLYLPPLQIC